MVMGSHGLRGGCLARSLRRGAYAIVVLAVLPVLSSCAKKDPEPDTLLSRGEKLLRDGRFHEAIAPLKQCLMLDPCNPGAHYYLGQAYLNAQFRTSIPPWHLRVALGELDFALACFKRNGESKVLERFSPAEFEVSCHMKKAQVHLRRLQIAIAHGMPIQAIEGFLKALEAEADAARAVMPDSTDVEHLDGIIAQFRGVKTPEDVAPPPAIGMPESGVI